MNVYVVKESVVLESVNLEDNFTVFANKQDALDLYNKLVNYEKSVCPKTWITEDDLITDKYYLTYLGGYYATNHILIELIETELCGY